MFEFTIENEQYRIDVNKLDELAIFSQFEKSTSKWKWKQVLESYDIGEDKLHKTVLEFLNKFLSMVNKTLGENHGDLPDDIEFTKPIDELIYRINNNLKVDGSEIKIIPW